MSKHDNGGPAFPVADIKSAEPGTLDAMKQMARGMTLRDYFAAHADQPGVAEIVRAAGLVWSAGQVYSPDEPDAPIHAHFDLWWQTLTNQERFALSSKVRYQQADAMLKARQS